MSNKRFASFTLAALLVLAFQPQSAFAGGNSILDITPQPNTPTTAGEDDPSMREPTNPNRAYLLYLESSVDRLQAYFGSFTVFLKIRF